MNRRGFVKALAALPAVVGGLISIPNEGVASPVRVAHPADAAGDLYRRDYPVSWEMSTPEFMTAIFGDSKPPDLFDEWLRMIGPDFERYCKTVDGTNVFTIPEPIKLFADCYVDGDRILGRVVGVDIGFDRTFSVGTTTKPKLGPDGTIQLTIKVEDNLSEQLEQIAAAAQEAALRSSDSFEKMRTDFSESPIPIFADDRHQWSFVDPDEDYLR